MSRWRDGSARRKHYHVSVSVYQAREWERPEAGRLVRAWPHVWERSFMASRRRLSSVTYKAFSCVTVTAPGA